MLAHHFFTLFRPVLTPPPIGITWCPTWLPPSLFYVSSPFLSLSLQLNCVLASEREKPAASCYGCTGWLHRPHQTLCPVLAVKLSGTLFKNRCWPTTFSHCSGRRCRWVVVSKPAGVISPCGRGELQDFGNTADHFRRNLWKVPQMSKDWHNM